MAYRNIYTTIWKDPYILDLDSVQKLVFIYLLTNDFTTQAGIYELSLAHAAMETGLTTERLVDSLKKFQEDGKIVYSFPTRELAIINWRKYNENSSYKTMGRVKKELETVKNPELVLYLYDPRLPLCDTEINKKIDGEYKKVPLIIKNPWNKHFKKLTDDELYEMRISIQKTSNKGYIRGINTASAITYTNTEHIHNINKTDTEQGVSEKDIFPSSDKPIKIHKHSNKRMEKIIAYSHKMKSFPDERRLLLNIPNSGDIADCLKLYSQEEIKQALDNYETCCNEPTLYRIHPYSSIINFITNSGISKFIDENNPLSKYNINSTNHGKNNHDIITDIEPEEF